MYLVIGGSNQGKLAWSLQHFSLNKQQVLDAAMLDLQPGQTLQLNGCLVIYGLESLLRHVMQQNWTPQELTALQNNLLQLPAETVIICASVGGGLVPVDRFEREWRELVGRTCCQLAAEATEVWRVFCGLPQRLK